MRGTGSHRQPRGCAGKRGGTGKWGGRKDERVWIRSWLPPKDLDPVDITTPSCFKADSASCAESESGQSRAKTRTLAGRPLRRDDGGQRAGIREPERGAGGWKNPFLRRRPLGCQSDALLITKGHHGGHRVSAGTKYKPRLKPLL